MDVRTAIKYAERGRAARAARGGVAGGRTPPNKTVTLMAVVTVIGVVFAFLPTAVLVAVGMVPSMVAYVVDVTPGRYAFRCVAGLNLAGITPYLYTLWTGPHKMNNTVDIISDAYAWLVLYGASGVGWLLFLGVPSLVATIQVLDAKRQVNSLREKQAALVREWGDEVRVEALQSLQLGSDDESMVNSAAAQADLQAAKKEREKETEEGDEEGNSGQPAPAGG